MYTVISEQEVIIDGKTYIEKKVQTNTQVATIREYKPTPEELSAIEYEQERAKYANLIQQAQLLGETDKVISLQAEWEALKTEKGWN